MAVEVCSDISSAGISPRISFSHDLKNTDDASVRVKSDLCLLDSTSDFVFCITNGFAQQLSSADELFSNGKIVPTEIKRVFSEPKEASRSRPATKEKIQKKRLKEFLSASSDEAENEEEKPSSKYFWQFKRSSSLNFDTTRGNGLIRSLQFLSRSNSTGSALPKQTELPRETHKQRLQKQSSVSSRRSSSSSTSSTYYFYSSSQKHSLKKNGGSSVNGVRISPVLNLPQAYIPKATARFFGFGSLFCNGKSKRNKKQGN